MKIKTIAVTLGFVALILRFYIGNSDQADGKLQQFYLEILSADFPAASKSINDAIELWPINARFYGWRAYAVSQNLPPRCSHSLANPVLTLNPHDLSSIQSGIENYSHVLSLNKRDAVALHNLAWLNHLLGNDLSAEANWREATSIDPDNAIFHISYGMFLNEKLDASRAQRQFQIAIELSPSVVDSPFFVRYKNGHSKEADSIISGAIQTLEQRLKHGSDPILEARLGKLYLFRHEVPVAAQHLEAALRQLPDLSLAWTNLGKVREEQQRLDEAMDCYKKAVFLDASLPEAYFRLGEIQKRKGQTIDAIKNLSNSIKSWQKTNPTDAAHNNRLYNGQIQKIDDLLPTTLIWFTSPCNASDAWMDLSALLPKQKIDRSKISTCESLPSPHN